MLDEFTMIIHHFDDEVDIVPIADVHLGSIEHNTKAWENFLLKMKDEPNTYLLLCGDLINNNIKSAVGNPFDEVYRPMEQKQIMTEHLAPISDRILCAVSGNHERRTKSGKGGVDQDLTYDIMTKLDIENRYRENFAVVKVSIGTKASQKNKNGKPTPNVSYIFVVTHGAAGGRLTGNAANRMEEWSRTFAGDLDCLVVGHSHKGIATRPQRLVIDAHTNTVKPQSYLAISAESWMSYGGYAAAKMLQPAENSHPQRLHLVRSRDFKRIELTW